MTANPILLQKKYSRVIECFAKQQGLSLDAAKYAKIKEVLVPAENKPDIQELDKEITDGLTITFVSSMKEVLNKALV